MATVNNNSISFSLPFLFIFLIWFSTTSIANEVISPFCTNEALQPDEKASCTRFVESAKTWPNAMTNAIKAAIQISIEAKPLVNGLQKTLPRGKEGIAKVCKIGLDNQIYYFQQCVDLDLVKNDQTSKLLIYLSGVRFSDCKNAFDENQIHNADVDRFYETSIKLANILISIFRKKPQN